MPVRVRLAAACLLAALTCLSACGRRSTAPPFPAPPPAGAQEVTLQTADGWTVHGDYTPAASARYAVVLLHQRNGSARDWAPLVPRLTAAGISALALDQRGAGRSTGKASGDDAPWDTSADIAAAVAWLAQKGYAANDVGLVGASYGANNALIYAAGHPDVPGVVLLSPGTDYHGLKIEPAARGYHGQVLTVYARDDSITEGGPAALTKAAAGSTQTKDYPGSAHGTDLLEAHPDAVGVIVSYLRARL